MKKENQMMSRSLQGAIMRFALCLLVLLTPLALLHAQVTTGTPFNLINENSGKCIGASGQGTANGTVLQMYTCANGTYSTQLSQEWIFTAASSGYYEVADANATTEAWNVVSNGTTNGSLMQIWSYAANPNEEFEPVSLGSGYYKFVGKGSGLCLDVPGNSTANSVQLDIYTCNGTTAQAFKLVTPSASSCTSVPGAPTGLAASGTTSTSTNLSWTASTVASGCSVTSYTVYENSSALATVTSGTSYAVSGLSASTTYSYTVAATDSDGTSAKSSTVSVTTSSSGSGEGPYGGVAAAIPGTVMAENYDTGGQGVGYDVSSTNGTANSYRSDGVDLEAASSPATGDDIGWTASGQWFRYTVNVSTAGTYTVSFLVAAESAISDAFHLSNSSGTNLSGSVAVPDTGGWQTWTTVTASVTLPAGQQTLTLDQDNGGWNIDSMVFASGSGGGGNSSCSGVANITIGGTTYTPTWCQSFGGAAAPAPTTAFNYDLGNNSGWGNGELEVYCGPPGYSGNPSQCPTTFSTSTAPVYIDGNGHLVIQPRDVGGTWISARLNTDGGQTFQYGILEASIELPNMTPEGIWPAFWALGNNINSGVSWPTCGESDILEDWSPSVDGGAGNAGENSTIHTELTGGDGVSTRYTFPSGEAADTGFHTYGMIWSENELQYFVDNPSAPFATLTPSSLPSGDVWPFNQPIFLILNEAIGGTLGGSAPASTPGPLYVSYIRYYQP
jgi:beta-glucanase (GH16 family)